NCSINSLRPCLGRSRTEFFTFQSDLELFLIIVVVVVEMRSLQTSHEKVGSLPMMARVLACIRRLEIGIMRVGPITGSLETEFVGLKVGPLREFGKFENWRMSPAVAVRKVF